MSAVEQLLINNKNWVRDKLNTDPTYFDNLSKGQTPQFLWIGCSDSRVPANEITGTRSGEIFVHRNVANLVIHTDVNLFSVLQFAVQVLGVKHVIVCGHTSCGGVAAAMSHKKHGLIDNWLRNVKDIYTKYEEELNAIADQAARQTRLTELVVIEQVYNLAKTTIIQDAWDKLGDKLSLHGWIYHLSDGVLRPLIELNSKHNIDSIYRLTE